MKTGKEEKDGEEDAVLSVCGPAKSMLTRLFLESGCAPWQAVGYHHTLVWQQRGRRSTVKPGESSFIHCSGSSYAVTPIQTLTVSLKDWGSVDSSPTLFSLVPLFFFNYYCT